MTYLNTNKATILIVDDNPENLCVFSDVLDSSEFEVLAAQSSQVLFERLEHVIPDLILLDVMMPGMDGFETCRQLKTNPITQTIPIIFMTALSDTQSKVVGLELGAVDYLTKPFHQEEVLARVRLHLKIHHLTQQLTTRNQYLEEFQRAKDELLTTISHDLRSPLSNIKTTIHLLETMINRQAAIQSSPALNSAAIQLDIRRYLRILDQECDRELNLINDLLEMQRLESHCIRPRAEFVDLNLLFQSLLETYQEQAQIRQQKLEIHLTAPYLTVMCCSTSLRRILSELLHNAHKYTPPGERIVMTALQQDTIQIRITNYGSEIPASDIPHIFEKFYRVPKLDRWHQGGTGLGLAIVKKLVDHLQGNIWVESDREKTTFILNLPGHSASPLHPVTPYQSCLEWV